jgi:hypothetical protein
MLDRVLVDNDILLKISAWQLDAPFLAISTTAAGPPAMLSVARYVVRGKLSRHALNDLIGAERAFDRLCEAMGAIEPELIEIEMAAALEEAAAQAGLELDVGESQLAARGSPTDGRQARNQSDRQLGAARLRDACRVPRAGDLVDPCPRGCGCHKAMHLL